MGEQRVEDLTELDYRPWLTGGEWPENPHASRPNTVEKVTVVAQMAPQHAIGAFHKLCAWSQVTGYNAIGPSPLVLSLLEAAFGNLNTLQRILGTETDDSDVERDELVLAVIGGLQKNMTADAIAMASTAMDVSDALVSQFTISRRA